MELFSLFNLLDVLGMIFKIEEFSINKVTDPTDSFTLCTRNWEERGTMNLLHSIYEMNGNKDSNILTEKSHGVAHVIIATNSSQIFQIFAKKIHNPKTYAGKMQAQPFVFIVWPECLNAEDNKPGNPMEKILIEFVNRLKNFEEIDLLTLESECYVVFLLEEDDLNTFHIYELYRKGNEYIYKFFARHKSFLETDSPKSMSSSFDGLVKRRSSMQGISLNVVGVENNEYEADTSFSVSKNGSVNFKDGFSVQLLTELELYYNFTVNAIKEDTWIDVVNESFVGMAKRIHNGDADLAISITGMLPYSAKTFTFLVPSYSMSISAFFRRSSSYQVRDIYFQPFGSFLWLALICMWILFPLIVVLIVHLKITLGGTREVEKNILISFQSDDDMVGENDCHFSEECFIWMFATICQQGWYYHPNSNSLRVIFAIALYSALVVYYSYSAKLVSTFALEIETIQSAEDLLRSSYILGIKDEIDLKSWFQEIMEHDEEKKSLLLGSKVSRKLSPIINERYILEISDAVQIVNKKHYSFVSYPDPFYIYIRKFYSDNHICKTYREIPLVKESFRTGMFVAKNSSYKEHFNYLLTALLENGMTQRNLNYYTLNYKTQCKGQMNNRDNKALHFNEIFTAIMFITFGNLLSIAILITEQVINARILRNTYS